MKNLLNVLVLFVAFPALAEIESKPLKALVDHKLGGHVDSVAEDYQGDFRYDCVATVTTKKGLKRRLLFAGRVGEDCTALHKRIQSHSDTVVTYEGGDPREQNTTKGLAMPVPKTALTVACTKIEYKTDVCQ